MIQFLVRTLFLVCRWPSSPFVLTWQREGFKKEGRGRGRKHLHEHKIGRQLSLSSYKGTNPILGAHPHDFILF